MAQTGLFCGSGHHQRPALPTFTQGERDAATDCSPAPLPASMPWQHLLGWRVRQRGQSWTAPISLSDHNTYRHSFRSSSVLPRQQGLFSHTVAVCRYCTEMSKPITCYCLKIMKLQRFVTSGCHISWETRPCPPSQQRQHLPMLLQKFS